MIKKLLEIEHLFGLFYDALIFEKRKTTLRSLSLASRMTASSFGRFTTKSGPTANLEFPDF